MQSSPIPPVSPSALRSARPQRPARPLAGLFRLRPYLRPLRLKLIAGAICTIAVSLLTLNNANLLHGLVDAIKAGQIGTLDHYALLILLFFGAKGLFTFGQMYCMANVTCRLAARLRGDIYEHLQKLSLSFYETQRTGRLMAAITSDVPVLQSSLASGVVDTLAAPVTIVGGTAWLLWTNWKLALVTLTLVPLLVLAILRAGKGMRRHSQAAQGSLADVSAIVEETLAGIRVVQSFVMESHEVARFTAESRRAFRYLMRGARVRATLGPVLESFSAIGMVFVLWFGGRQVIAGGLTIGELGGFVLVLSMIAGAFRSLGNIHVQLQQGRAAAERIFELLDVAPTIADRPGVRDLPRLEGAVAFEHVTFGYVRDLPVLRDLSFSLRPGEIGALVGESGSGKSTVANLIPRFYDVGQGSVRVDGFDVRDVPCASLRSQVGIVPQETLLFSGTVRENIAYGRLDATQTEIEEAARAANAHEFVMNLPDGYATLVGERGLTLSGGQRQRIAIARALLKDPRILILDEATSSLDARAEALVQEALERLMAGRTTLVIAHRLSTVRKADQILVMDAGRIVERGTHDELLRMEGVFARLYHRQFGAARADGPARS
jgi:ATP-binding cassette, subfamily B, bacterial MsbA